MDMRKFPVKQATWETNVTTHYLEGDELLPCWTKIWKVLIYCIAKKYVFKATEYSSSYNRETKIQFETLFRYE